MNWQLRRLFKLLYLTIYCTVSCNVYCADECASVQVGQGVFFKYLFYCSFLLVSVPIVSFLLFNTHLRRMIMLLFRYRFNCSMRRECAPMNAHLLRLVKMLYLTVCFTL